MPPLSDREVIDTAASAWGYEQRGENRFGKTGAWFTTSEVNRFAGDADAFWLWSYVVANNQPDAEFWIADGLAEVWDWERKRLIRARKRLIDAGYIDLVRRGYPGQPALYRRRR